jgi:dipeptidyl-peptidase-4
VIGAVAHDRAAGHDVQVTRPSLAVPFLFPFAALAQDAHRALEPIDMFRLEFQMLLPAEEPHGWLDAEHYLVFDPGRPAVQGQRSWFAVEAQGGKRLKIVDRKTLGRALQELGLPQDAIGAVDELDNWTWNADHTRFVVNVGGDLFVGDRSCAMVRLTQTPAAAEEIVQWSPDGARVSFVRDHNVFVVPAGGGAEVAISKDGNADRFFGKLDWVYQEEVFGRGDFRATWWSPDATHLAFLDLDEAPVQEFTIVAAEPARPAIERVNYPKAGEPNPKVWLCTAPAAGGELQRFDVSKYADDDRLIVRVTWAPDGKEVFFQVQNREQTWLDMLAGDVATGAVRTVFHEASDCWVEPGPEPQWLGGGAEFLWLSERSGYRHLYRYGRDGKELGAVTHGEWQVKKVVAVDAQKGVVWYLGDQSSPLQTHLYTVAVAGGEPVQVTKGRGTHDVTMAPDNAHFLTSWSSAEDPPRTLVCDGAGAEVRQVNKPRVALLDPYGLTPPQFVQVKTRDGFPMEAMLIKPPDYSKDKRYPVVQFTYSGPHTPRVRDEWGSRDYVFHQLLAQHGFVVFTCDNRSASGKGRTFAKACWRSLGSTELQDLEDAVKWLVGQGIADDKRIGIWGWSYGGYQTLFNLTHSSAWACGVAVNPVTDWANYDTIYTERYLGTPQDNRDGYSASSAVAAAANLHGELMLCAAAMDDNVHMQNSLQFLQALQMAGKDCDFMVYPGVRHGIETLPQQVHLFSRLLRFFERTLH